MQQCMFFLIFTSNPSLKSEEKCFLNGSMVPFYYEDKTGKEVLGFFRFDQHGKQLAIPVCKYGTHTLMLMLRQLDYSYVWYYYYYGQSCVLPFTSSTLFNKADSISPNNVCSVLLNYSLRNTVSLKICKCSMKILIQRYLDLFV